MTLLEMSIVIAVLILLISVLFVGARAWKRGADRAACIVNLHNIQKGVRGFANLYGHSPGENVVGLRERVIGPGRFLEQLPLCPGGGIYEFGKSPDGDNPDMIPHYGVPYASCSLPETEGHQPTSVADW